MSFATNMQSVASTLLTNYGQAIAVTRDNIGAYNTSSGTATDDTDTNYTGYGHPSVYANSEIDNTIIKQGDIKLIFYSSTVPLVDDVFTIDSRAYTARSIERYKAQGSNIVYIVQLRQ